MDLALCHRLSQKVKPEMLQVRANCIYSDNSGKEVLGWSIDIILKLFLFSDPFDHMHESHVTLPNDNYYM